LTLTGVVPVLKVAERRKRHHRLLRHAHRGSGRGIAAPAFASELAARLRATSCAMAVLALEAAPAAPIWVVPATAWVACVPLTAPPAVLT
jgi:hypothetical protein